MLSSARCSVQDTLLPCITIAPRQPVRAFNRAFKHSCNRKVLQNNNRALFLACFRAQGVHPHDIDPAKQKLWPTLGVLSTTLASPRAASADEVTTAAGDVAQAATKATADLPPTVTFGGSFGQYDPIIAFFFYAVIAALTVLTLGVRHRPIHIPSAVTLPVSLLHMNVTDCMS